MTRLVIVERQPSPNNNFFAFESQLKSGEWSPIRSFKSLREARTWERKNLGTNLPVFVLGQAGELRPALPSDMPPEPVVEPEPPIPEPDPKPDVCYGCKKAFGQKKCYWQLVWKTDTWEGFHDSCIPFA